MGPVRHIFLVVAMTLFALSASARPVTYIVDFEDDVSAQQISKIESEVGVDVKPNSFLYGKTRITTVTLDSADAAGIMEQLEDTGLVENLEEQVIYSAYPLDTGPTYGEEFDSQSHWYDFSMAHSDDFPNDPLYKEGKQWNMTMIGVEKAWKVTQGEGVIVAVLDTGVSDGEGSYNRVPDLKQTCMVGGYNFIDDNTDAYDGNAHGTHVAGTIAQSTNNGIGVVGIAHKACIMPVKVLSDQGYGSTADIAEAIIWATDMGAHVINMSLGGGGFSQVMADAIAYAAENNVFVACAAGNSGRGVIEYPAAMDGCHAVSSVGKSGDLAFYSSYGDNGNGLFIAAPGGDQKADGPEGGIWQDTIARGDPTKHGYFPFQGTSMATPHVAGVAALVIAELGPEDYTVESVAKILSKTADNKKDKKRYGNGLINAEAAVKAASNNEEGLPLSTWLLSALAALLTITTVRRLFT